MEANEPRWKSWKITCCLNPIALIYKMRIKCLPYRTLGKNKNQREKKVKISIHLLA